MTDELRGPATDAEWRAYHDIRRHVLFDRRGRGTAYDPNHPDDSRPGHYPLILWSGTEPVAVIRVDIDARVAIFRRVAVREDVQRIGHGRRMLTMAEQFAHSRGCSRIDSHVDAGAIGFYERCGFHRVANEAPDAETVLMTKPLSDARSRSSNDPVIDWLLDADPSIRWQVMRDLTDTPAEIVAAERSRVASEGWGPRLLDQQRPDGQWGDGIATPFWWSNMYTLLFLRDLGVDPTSARARTAIDLVRSNVTWGPEFGDSPFFEGEVEPCINGRVVALGAYFGERTDRLVDRLLSEQLADGGWNCEAERGSVRSSFHTTICVLEGLLAFEQAFGATSAVTDARTRAQEYLLERRLLRRLSTGEIIKPTWTQFAFPTLWHYDVLRALDYLRAAGVQPDARAEEAVAAVIERRQGDGRWLLDVRHRDTLHEELAGTVGAPNRWITLRALRVLDWYARRD
jgi:GNAT superfamily N-acetyltransferase